MSDIHTTMSYVYPSPCSPAHYCWQPPVNVTQFMRLAGGLQVGIASSISAAIKLLDNITDSLYTDWEVPGEWGGSESRRKSNTSKAAEIT